MVNTVDSSGGVTFATPTTLPADKRFAFPSRICCFPHTNVLRTMSLREYIGTNYTLHKTRKYVGICTLVAWLKYLRLGYNLRDGCQDRHNLFPSMHHSEMHIYAIVCTDVIQISTAVRPAGVTCAHCWAQVARRKKTAVFCVTDGYLCLISHKIHFTNPTNV